MPEEIRVEYGKLVTVVSQFLANIGIPLPICDVEAEVMTECDLLGVPSHGVIMLPGLVQAARDGRLNINPQLEFRRDKGAVCVLDCDNGPGRYVAVQAMSQAQDRAKRFGAGVCLAANTTHWGRAYSYAYRAAQAGMIGICTTNASLTMVGWGAKRPNQGNNPLAIAIPRGRKEPPIVLDIAMSQAAVGKIVTYQREGKPAPPSWGLDDSGRPTDDPAAIVKSGRALPMGEHKGAGLALMIELLTAALAGGPLCYELTEADPTILNAGSAKLFIALDVDEFANRKQFQQRIVDMLTYLKETAADQTFLYPGQRGWEARERNLAEGVPIHLDIVAQLEKLGLKLT